MASLPQPLTRRGVDPAIMVDFIPTNSSSLPLQGGLGRGQMCNWLILYQKIFFLCLVNLPKKCV